MEKHFGFTIYNNILIQGEKKRVAFLDLMLESAQNGVVMNDNDIKEEVDTIMFEVSKIFFQFGTSVWKRTSECMERV